MSKRVVLCIPELGVRAGGWERNKEIYVISFATDLGAVGNGPKMPDAIAAYNETLVNATPNVMGADMMRYVVVAVSNVFPRVRADQPVSLSGSGIILYPDLDPNGVLASHFVIVESDEGTRNLGKLLDQVSSDQAVTKAVAALIAAASPTQPLLAALMNALVSQTPKILKKNKDDLLFAHSHSGFVFDNYGCRPGESASSYQLGNDRAFCTLRVLVREQKPS